MERSNVFDYIKAEELDYRTKYITLGDNWNWNMYEHVNMSFLFKHSKFTTGDNTIAKSKRPFKNIIRPILNVAYRSEGFDVKDIEPYVNDVDNYHKSLLVRKFHPRWALDNGIDTFIDELVESYVDYGGALVKNVNDVRPEVVPLQRLAFVDQRDMLSGAICEKHIYSVSELTAMKGRWDAEKIDECIVLSRRAKPNSQGTGEERANSKALEVYELHGTFPETWIKSDGDPDVYSKQIHIVTFYKDEKGKDAGISLFKGKESKDIYKVLVRDGIYNRALGFGGVEELFEPQVWTNYNIIQIKEMLDVASLMIMNTQDQSFAQRNNVGNMKKGEITYSTSPLTQVNIQPINIGEFVASINQWEQSGRITGSASDPQLGLNPTSGTPLGTTQIVTGQGQGIHEYRQGKVATFVSEIYRDWVLDFLVSEMNKGQKFIEELSVDELQEVADCVANNYTNLRTKEMIMSGMTPTQDQINAFKDLNKQNFIKGGTKRFFEVVKNDLKSLPVDVLVNIAGKQADLAGDVTKLSNVFRQIIANPQGFIQAMQIPAVAKTFNSMLEYSGMNRINFGASPATSLQFPTNMTYGAPQQNGPISQPNPTNGIINR